MRQLIASALALMVWLTFAGRSAVAEEQPPESPPPKTVEVGDFLVAQPIRSKNLTVFPVLSKMPKNEDRYIILEEGLKSGKVVVYEVGGQPQPNPPAQQAPAQQAPAQQAPVQQSPAQQQPRNNQPPNNQPQGVQAPGVAGDVNHLMVLNRSDKPLYLMPGEIIHGGKQDRCIGKEYVIAPGEKPVKIEVYCVERGRWNYQGRFAGKAGNLNKKGRETVQSGKGQSKVWDSVGESNNASGAQTPTDAFTANYTNPKILKMIESYVKDVERPVAESHQVVGAIVAVGDKIEVVDVFGSTPLFRKVWPKLLAGHALDAATATKPKSKAKTKKPSQPPTLADAEKFLKTAMEAAVQNHSVGKDGMVVTKRESKNLTSYSACEKQESGAMGGMGGGFNDSVHSSGFAR